MTTRYAVYSNLGQLASREFGDLVVNWHILCLPNGDPTKLRLEIVDGSFLDIYCAPSGRYSYHWDRREQGDGFYRHDNAPHKRLRHLATYPKHFHAGQEDKTVESQISDQPELALCEFLMDIQRLLPAKITQEEIQNETSHTHEPSGHGDGL